MTTMLMELVLSTKIVFDCLNWAQEHLIPVIIHISEEIDG